MTEPTREPQNPDFRSAIVQAFAAETAMAHIGANLETVRAGYVEIGMPCWDQVMSHRPPVVHGGTIAMIAESAMGYAALSLLPADQDGFTAEYKINYLKPAVGQRLVARASVIRAGVRLTVARADVSVLRGDAEEPVATTLGTFAHVPA